MKSRQVVACLTSKSGVIHALSFSPDGERLSAGYSDGSGNYPSSVVVWDTLTWVRHAEFNVDGAVLAIKYSSDGSVLAVGTGIPKGSVVLWNPSSKQQIGEFFAEDLGVKDLVFLNESEVVATAGGYDIKFWRNRGADNFASLQPSGSSGNASCLALTRDKRILAGSIGNCIYAWSGETREPLSPVGATRYAAAKIAFSPSGPFLAAWGGGSPNASGYVTLWNYETCEKLSELSAHKQTVSCGAFSPDGHVLASGSHDGTVILWAIAE